MLNYAILSLPRVAGTKFQLILSQGIRHNLRCYVPYYGEFLLNHSIEELNSLLAPSSVATVVKLLTQNFTDSSIKDVHWEKFDCVYAITRSNLVDQLISTYTASSSGQWQKFSDQEWKPVESITITDEQIDEFVSCVFAQKRFTEYVTSRIPPDKVVHVTYEQICEMTLFNLTRRILPTDYDYSKTCSNYEYVKSRLEEKIRNGR